MKTMMTRTLGPSDLTVSALGLGCNNFGRPGTTTEQLPGTEAVIEAAIEAGITFFDTADVYGSPVGRSEQLIGEALRGRADGLVIATKFGHQDVDAGIAPGSGKGSREYVRGAVDASLRRLRVEVIDLFQMHTPDPITPIEETISALEELVREGRIRWYGHTNFSAGQMREAHDAAVRLGATGFIGAQDEYSMLERGVEADRLPLARELGLGFVPYFPLASGLLTGKYGRDRRPVDARISRQRPEALDTAPWDVIEGLERFAESRGVPMVAIAFGWLLAQPGLTSVIAGATSPAQVVANAAAAGQWKPMAGDLEQLDGILS